MEGSILEELTAPEKCGGTPLHAWDQLQDIWMAMLMYRDSILADEKSSRAGDDLLRKLSKRKGERSGRGTGGGRGDLIQLRRLRKGSQV